MLPGLMRMQCAPASIAFRASVWLKWMSAITGIGDSRTIARSASTPLSRGTAQRIRSPPAAATARIWRRVASTSAVSVLVIDWTTTGAPPPIGTPPTLIWRSDGIALRVRIPAADPDHSEPRDRPRPDPGDPDVAQPAPAPAGAHRGAGRHLLRLDAPGGDGH